LHQTIQKATEAIARGSPKRSEGFLPRRKPVGRDAKGF
jgi:hypothetical protein